MNFGKLTLALAALVLAGAMVGVVAAEGDGTLSTTIENDIGWLDSSVEPHEDVVRYGGNPSWVVEVDAGEVGTLESWAGESEERVIRAQNGERVLVSAPTEDVVDPALFGAGDGLYTLSYVQSVDYNMRVSMVEPVDPTGFEELGRVESFVTEGEFGAGKATDANTTTLSTARSNVGADGVAADGTGVTVAVVDTGLNYDSDLYGNRVVAGKDFVDDRGTIDASNGDYSAIADGNGHGSWVASAVAADPTDTSYTGIAPGADLVIARALDDDGGGETANIVDAVEWACTEQGTDIVVMSLGSPVYSESMDDQVTECATEFNTAVFIAAGNSGENPALMYLSSPADTPTTGTFAVGATTNELPSEASVASFSEVGPNDGITSVGHTVGETPDLAAPGMSLEAQVADESGTVKVRELSGTSMATPIAAGTFAVAMEADSTLQGDPAAVADRIEQSSARMPGGAENEVGHGMADAAGYADAVERDQTQVEARNDEAVSRDLFYESYSSSRIVKILTTGLGL